MRAWFLGRPSLLAAFAGIAVLVIGGLGWVTMAALRLEDEHLQERARQEQDAQVQLALSLLDNLVGEKLGRENSRPYNYYSAISAPSLAFHTNGEPYPPGSVLEPSPLLSTDLPDWMLLHFQADEESGWGSPQVLTPSLLERFQNAELDGMLVNVTPARTQLLAELSAHLSPRILLAEAERHGAVPTLRDTTLVPSPRNSDNQAVANAVNPQAVQQQNFDPMFQAQKRRDLQSRLTQEQRGSNQKDDLAVAFNNTSRNGEDWFRPLANKRQVSSEPIEVMLSPLVPLWLTTGDGQKQLVVARVVRIANKQVCQGIVLDGQRLQALLTDEVDDLFAQVRVEPVREEASPAPERTLRHMTTLPFQLDPGPAAAAAPGWTPLRVGLTLAWAAALVAVLAVGLGGWSLLDLSERRIRFVSAVTHELRTPLTTLRLYLDMLTGGLVREERQREEYLHTLHAETERLNRLVGNVLDFSRLENRRPRLVKAEVPLGELLEQVRTTWQGRCQAAGKELVVASDLPAEAVLATDVELVHRVLGNLIDNACKYSRDAADNHVWLRARGEGGRLVLEVEDRGPGVPLRERRSIFHPFRRGRDVETTAGGVGLGLALAQRWARLLGGSLVLRGDRTVGGACFRVELPMPPA